MAKLKATAAPKPLIKKLKPYGDRVIVEPHPTEEKTAGGVIIPDTAKEKPVTGTVIAAGPGKKDEPMEVKPGDNVVFSKFSGTELEIEGRKMLMMRESEIITGY